MEQSNSSLDLGNLSFFAQVSYFKEFLLYFGTLLLSSFVGAHFTAVMWQEAFCRRSDGGKKGGGHMAASGSVAVCFTVAVAILAKAQKTSLAIPGVWPSPGS